MLQKLSRLTVYNVQAFNSQIKKRKKRLFASIFLPLSQIEKTLESVGSS